MIEIPHDKFTSLGIETGKNLANPYIMICLPGTKLPGATLNSTSLLDQDACPINYNFAGDEDFVKNHLLGQTSRQYEVFSITGEFTDDGPAIPSNVVLHAHLMGFLPEEIIERQFPKTNAYFSKGYLPNQREIEEPIPEDDIPF